MKMEQQQKTAKDDLQKIINDYEDVLNGLRREYEEKIVNLGKYYRTKAREHIKEKEKMQQKMTKLEEENDRLIQIIKGHTLEQVELVNRSQDKIQHKKGMKKSYSQNSPFKQGKKDNQFKKVLNQINDYMTNNFLELENNNNQILLDQEIKNDDDGANSDYEPIMEPEFLQKMQASSADNNQDSNLWAFNNNHHHKPKGALSATKPTVTRDRKENTLSKHYYESEKIRERASYREKINQNKSLYSPLMNNSAILSSFQSQDRKNKLSFS